MKDKYIQIETVPWSIPKERPKLTEQEKMCRIYKKAEELNVKLKEGNK